MPHSIHKQVPEHENIDKKDCVESKINKSAVANLFQKQHAKFSKRNINLSEVVTKSLELDREYVTEIICEIAELKSHDFKKMKAVTALLKKHLSVIALDMNKEAA